MKRILTLNLLWLAALPIAAQSYMDKAERFSYDTLNPLVLNRQEEREVGYRQPCLQGGAKVKFPKLANPHHLPARGRTGPRNGRRTVCSS